MDLTTAASYVAPFGLVAAAAIGSARRPQRGGARLDPTARQPRRRRPQQPQPEVQQRPGWGADSALPPDAITVEA